MSDTLRYELEQLVEEWRKQKTICTPYADQPCDTWGKCADELEATLNDCE